MNIKSFFHTLFKRGTIIQWDAPSRSSVQWKIENGKLLLDGRDMTPVYPISKQDLEKALKSVLKKIKKSGLPITIKRINIEKHIAKGLWDEGTITEKDLLAGSYKTGHLEINMNLLTIQLPVRVVQATYYSDYEFIIEGHPEGIIRTRDVPDALATIGGERFF